MSSTLLAFVFAFSALIMTWLVGQVLTKTASSYYEEFNRDTKLKLADLFLFIEPEKILQIKFILFILSTLVAYFFVEKLIPAVLFGVFIWFSPSLIFKILKKKRREKFLSAIPDMLQSVSTAMRSGASLNQSIETVNEEQSGPIQQEFDLFMREIRMGIDFNDALDNLYERMPILDLKLVISGMKISREIGGNLAETLERMADTLRRKLEMEGKIDALTAQGRAQGYVMTALPILLGLVLYQMEPEQMARLWQTWYGWVVITIVVFLETLGYFFIKKIVDIDV